MFQKILFILPIVACILAQEKPKELPNNQRELHGDNLKEAIQELDDSLIRVAELGGPAYKRVKVHNATEEYSEGVIYRYNTILSDKSDVSRDCKVLIEISWLRLSPRTTVEINCVGVELFTISYSSLK